MLRGKSGELKAHQLERLRILLGHAKGDAQGLILMQSMHVVEHMK